MFNYVRIKHKQMSFVSNGGKFKLYTVLNGLIFPTPTQPRISFERPIEESEFIKLNFKFEISNFCANVKVKMTSRRTAVRQIANTDSAGV
jgi:hypothetical protein